MSHEGRFRKLIVGSEFFGTVPGCSSVCSQNSQNSCNWGFAQVVEVWYDSTRTLSENQQEMNYGFI